MSGITLAQAEAKLSAVLDAYDTALKRSSYSVTAGEDSRSMSYQSLADLENAVKYWEKKVRRLRKGGIVVRGATPVTE